MLIAAGIIYFVFAILTGPLWPLDLLAGKGGPFGRFLVALWIVLLIAGGAKG
jgi:hypothetical protein